MKTILLALLISIPFVSQAEKIASQTLSPDLETNPLNHEREDEIKEKERERHQENKRLVKPKKESIAPRVIERPHEPESLNTEQD